jgi:hypothetical protein
LGTAIDLVIHLLDFSFVQSVIWLSETFSIPLVNAASETTNPVQISHKSTLILPRADPSRLNRIRGYLVQTRRLPEHLIQNLLSAGDLYADFRSNAVFVMRDSHRQISGAEIRGTGTTPFKGLAKGSVKTPLIFPAGRLLPIRLRFVSLRLMRSLFLHSIPTFG